MHSGRVADGGGILICVGWGDFHLSPPKNGAIIICLEIDVCKIFIQNACAGRMGDSGFLASRARDAAPPRVSLSSPPPSVQSPRAVPVVGGCWYTRGGVQDACLCCQATSMWWT